MPMFYTPKPRQFKYRPRFYDPEKERWEMLKAKYALEKELEDGLTDTPDGSDLSEPLDVDDKELEYFQRRVRELDRKERRKGLTWKDAFRKREMPTFNYQPRFSAAGDQKETSGERKTENGVRRKKNIKRRFDVSDTDYMKPIPAGRIMLYALLVCLLLYWILF